MSISSNFLLTFKLSTGNLVTTDSPVHTTFGFSTSFVIQLETSSGQTDGQSLKCGLLERPINNIIQYEIYSSSSVGA